MMELINMNKLYFLYLNSNRKFVIDHNQLELLTKQLNDPKLEWIDINPCEMVRHEMLGENDKIQFQDSDFCSCNDDEIASYREGNGYYFIGRSNHHYGFNKKKLYMYQVCPHENETLKYKMEKA